VSRFYGPRRSIGCGWRLHGRHGALSVRFHRSLFVKTATAQRRHRRKSNYSSSATSFKSFTTLWQRRRDETTTRRDLRQSQQPQLTDRLTLAALHIASGRWTMFDCERKMREIAGENAR